MTFTVSPDLIENNDVEITTDANGTLAIRDRANNTTVTLDEDVAISAKADDADLTNKADLDGAGTAELTNYQSVDTVEAITTALRQQPNDQDQNIVDRDIVSSSETEIYVDPATGADSNPGTEAEPVQTIIEALQRLPFIIQHRTRIFLADGTYDQEASRIGEGQGYATVPYLINSSQGLNVGGGMPFGILGNTTDPSLVEVPTFANGGLDRLSLSLDGHDTLDTQVSGITFNGTVVNRGGTSPFKTAGSREVRRASLQGATEDSWPSSIRST